MRTNRSAFTLIEILLVAALITILSTLVEANISDLGNRMNGLKCAQNLRQIMAAKYDYAIENPGTGSPTTTNQIALFQSYFPQGFVGVADACPSTPSIKYDSNSVYNIYTTASCPNNAPSWIVLDPAVYPYAVDAYQPYYSINGYHNLGHATTTN